MAKRIRGDNLDGPDGFDQLDKAVNAVVSEGIGRPARLSPQIAALIRIAADLRSMPSEDFKQRLRDELTGARPSRRPKSKAKESKPEESNPVREGFHAVTPYILVDGAADLIAFVVRAFCAEQRFRTDRSDGKILHSEIKIGDSMVEIADTPESFEPMPAAMHFYVEDVDLTYAKAIAAGATSTQQPADQRYGDYEAGVKDGWGNQWYIGKHTSAEPLPVEIRTITPYLHPEGAQKVIGFLKEVFGAEEAFKTEEGGVIHHAKIRIGDSMIEIGEAHGRYQAMPTALHVYVKDTDAAYARAIKIGAKRLYGPRDHDYGERGAGVADPFGNHWYIATDKRRGTLDIASKRESARQPKSSRKVRPVPQGYHTITPYMTIREAVKAMDFMKNAFGAVELTREGDPHGHFHGELKIGDSIVMIGSAGQGAPETSSQAYLYVPDVDAMYRRAINAGGVSTEEPKDTDYGDRRAGVADPFGNLWFIATHKRDVTH